MLNIDLKDPTKETVILYAGILIKLYCFLTYIAVESQTRRTFQIKKSQRYFDEKLLFLTFLFFVTRKYFHENNDDDNGSTGKKSETI